MGVFHSFEDTQLIAGPSASEQSNRRTRLNMPLCVNGRAYVVRHWENASVLIVLCQVPLEWDMRSDSKIRREVVLVDAAHIWAPREGREGRGAPKRLAVGTCSTRCRGVQKTASEAVENSGQSPRNLLCAGKLEVEHNTKI
jgi:hypothetical protein